MATYKVLAQSAPSAATATTLPWSQPAHEHTKIVAARFPLQREKFSKTQEAAQAKLQFAQRSLATHPCAQKML